MPRLTLASSNSIIAAAFAKAKELGLKPLGVAVLDAG
ncbi:heme-binding protein, partial [Rhizobiaceae sp. 2RAB30]